MIKIDSQERAAAQGIGGAGHLDLLQDSANEQLADLEAQAAAAHGVKLDDIDDLDQTEAVSKISAKLFADSFGAQSVRPSARRNNF